jgi:hypothetical protein
VAVCLLLCLLARIATGWTPFARFEIALASASLVATWVLLEGWRRCPHARAPAALRAAFAAAACMAIALAGNATTVVEA